MSLENAISDHAAAIRELAAAIVKAGDRVTTTHQIGDASKTVTSSKPDAKTDKADPAKKDPPAAKQTAATGKPGATPPANAGASSIGYEQIKAKILAFAKQPEGREKLTALLQRFGVAKGPDLTADQYEKFDADITRAMDGEFDPRDAEEHKEIVEEENLA